MSDDERITAKEVGQSPDRPHGRQAVILIHGIGEQQPMNTLRDFINGLYPAKGGGQHHVFSKPDRISEVLDLRRMSATAAVTGNATDFYELYWAHLMQGSTLAHVGDWFFMLLRRPYIAVPERLRVIWLMSWAILIGAGILAVYYAYTGITQDALFSAGLVGFLLYVFRSIFRKIALSHLADAARYLRPAPENIGIRQAIRNAGIDVLRQLHEEPMQRYDRIVVVGHSLGSVIAYDILTHLWQEMHWLHTKPVDAEQPRYEEMKNRLSSSSGSAGKLESFRTIQKELLREEQALGMPWKVTDLVTLGSPLTYAEFLLADPKYPLDRRKQEREFPTCPPQLEDARDIGFLSPSYRLNDGLLEKKKLLHHAALFACTRWTNIYFLSDRVGGPVGLRSKDDLKKVPPIFGDGIKDIPLTGCTVAARTVRSHVRYWNAREPEACDAVKKAMCLCEERTVQHSD